MRLIDADALKNHISELMLVYKGTELDNAILNAIDNAPTVEYPEQIIIKCDTEEDKQKLLSALRNARVKVLVEEERPTGEWVLCSDRLPNEFDEVLCCDRWGGLMIGRIKKNYHGRFTAKDDCDCLVMIDCLAWMPLPEAYKEAENEL